MTREPPRARRRRGADEESFGDVEIAGVVAVVGYPNVGKSTLVNRLSGRRETVVHEQPGVTRDRKELEIEWNGRRFRLIDTGGVDIASSDPITRQVATQARTAIAEADLALFVVDVRAGVGPGDEEIATILRRARIPVLLVANKVDDPRALGASAELHRLGLGDPFEISALHGHGAGDLLDEIIGRLAALPSARRVERRADEIGVAVLGRPNVGKSSLVNALVGSDRVIVSDIPGTTRDTIDTLLERGETRFRLIDTAGLRRKRKHRQEVEFWSEQRALQAAERADVALILIDGFEGLTDADLAVADAARKAWCATLVVVSKWDIAQVDLDALRERIAIKLRQRPLIVTTSSVTGRGLERLLDSIEELHGRYTSRMPTPQVNRVLKEAVERREPPRVDGRRLKLVYGAQVQTRPPRFRVTVNDRKLIVRDFAYYLENRLREAADLAGCPVIIDFITR